MRQIPANVGTYRTSYRAGKELSNFLHALLGGTLVRDGFEHVRDARRKRGEAAEATLDRILEAVRVLLEKAHRLPRVERLELLDLGVAALLSRVGE